MREAMLSVRRSRFPLLVSALCGALSGGALLTACSGSEPGEGGDLHEDTGTVVDTGTESGPVVDTGPTPSFRQIRIEPANAVVKIDVTGGTPAPGKQAFKALELQGDKEVDVSATTAFEVVDTTLGSFAGNTFTSTTALPAGVRGKSTTIRGEPGKGVANVTVIALRTSGDQRDFFFTVPYQKDPDPPKDILKFGTKIKQVDVGILVDTTASMGEEIANLRESLNTTFIPDLKKAIPNVAIGVAKFEDFPVKPFGFDGTGGGRANVPYELIWPITSEEAAAKSAVQLLQVYAGGELPESQYEAQYQILTGAGFTWTAAKAGSIEKRAPPPGTSGGASFRAGALPVVVQVSDASWFDKATYAAATSGGLDPHSKADVVSAYDAIKARFVGVASLIEKGGVVEAPCTDSHLSTSTNYKNASCDSARGFQQAIEMAQATNSVLEPSAFVGCAAGKCCTGVGGAPVDPIAGKCPLVYAAKPDGAGVASGIVSAITAIAIGATFDVTAIPSDDPSDVDIVDGLPVDATKFIAYVRAMDEGHVPSMCKPHATRDGNGDGIKDTFVAIRVGDPVCFEVVAKKNELVKPAPGVPQFFLAYLDVVGLPGSVKLDRREVLFLVPPKEQSTK